jgi:hypothetical protein
LGFNENERVTVHSEVGSMPGISDTALSSNQGRQGADVLSGGQSIGGRRTDKLSRTPAFKGRVITLEKSGQG